MPDIGAMSQPCPFTALIVTCRRPGHLERNLASIAAQTRRPAQIVVVDDDGGLDPEAARRIAEGAKIEWTFWRRDKLDYMRSRNLGVQFSRHPIVALLDDDVELERDYFEHLIGSLETLASQGVICVTARVLLDGASPRPKPLREAMERFFLRRGRFIGQLLPNGFATEAHRADRIGAAPFEVDFCLSGACAFFRDTMLAHPFAEGYSLLAHGTDKIMSLEIIRRGRIAFVPAARMTHFLAPAARPAPAVNAKRSVLSYYWTYRQIKRRPRADWTFALFAWGWLGFFLQEMASAARGRKSHGIAHLGGLLLGFGSAIRYQCLGMTLKEAVIENAARMGMPIDQPVGLEDPPASRPRIRWTGRRSGEAFLAPNGEQRNGERTN